MSSGPSLPDLWRRAAYFYNPDRQYADHQRPVEYEIRPPRPLAATKPTKAELYVHMPAPVHRPASAV